MSKRQITRLQKILLGSAIFLIAIIFDVLTDLPLGVTAIPYVFGYIFLSADIFIETFINFKSGKFLDENLLICVASLGALIIGKFSGSIAVILFAQISKLFESYAVGKARKNIKDLMHIAPQYANIEKDGKIITVDPKTIKIGDELTIAPGETVPVDSVVIMGNSYLDVSAINGEKLPKEVIIGDQVLSGSINTFSNIKIKAIKTYGNSTATKIENLIENSNNKTKLELFTEKFSKIYTPIIVILAVLLAVIPSLITGDYKEYITRALVFLVVASQCSLTISVPLSFFAGMGMAGNNGILIKGGKYLESFANTDTVIFDKTGTVTKGNFKVSKIVPTANIPAYKLLELAAATEWFSNHPIAESLKKEYNGKINTASISEVNEISGCGVIVKINGKKVAVGNHKLMKMLSLRVIDDIGTVVHVAVENEYMGHIIISDEIKEDSKTTIKNLRKNGIKRIYMFTGDNKEIAAFTANEVGINDFYCEMLPQQKAEKVDEIKQHSKTVCFVGDGINDAPALARSDIGIVMDGVLSDKVIESADIVLMNSELSRLCIALKICKKTLLTVRQNLVFILAIKFICLLFGALGITGLIFSVIANVFTLMVSVFNSVKLLKQF